MHKVSGALGGTALCILGQIHLWLVHWLGFAQGCTHPLCAQCDWEEDRICVQDIRPIKNGPCVHAQILSSFLHFLACVFLHCCVGSGERRYGIRMACLLACVLLYCFACVFR